MKYLEGTMGTNKPRWAVEVVDVPAANAGHRLRALAQLLLGNPTNKETTSVSFAGNALMVSQPTERLTTGETSDQPNDLSKE